MFDAFIIEPPPNNDPSLEGIMCREAINQTDEVRAIRQLFFQEQSCCLNGILNYFTIVMLDIPDEIEKKFARLDFERNYLP